MDPIEIVVNGRATEVAADGSVPLLWILREALGLTGTRFGCGVGACGACTVLVGGEPLRSCQLALSAVGKRPVVTIEGLGADEPSGLHRVQRAWLDEDVAQCGYCQPGMILAAAHLLATHPSPSPADVDAAFDGHLCRCGTYPRIRAAVKRAASQSGAPK